MLRTSYFYYYTAVPDTGNNGTLVAIPYKWPDPNQPPFFTYGSLGSWVDRGDLVYSSTLNGYYEFVFQLGARLTHKSGFDGIGVDIYVDGTKWNTTTVYLYTGQVYFEMHPNTLTDKRVRVVIVDKTYQDFCLQTGVDIWVR